MTDPKWQWTPHTFELFRLTCDILVGGQVAILVNEQTPDTGYLSQSLGEVVLTVTYGPDSEMDQLLEETLNDENSEASIIRDRHPTRFCGHPAERMIVRIDPSSSDVPFILVMVGTHIYRVPLTAVFQKPNLYDPLFDGMEMHFFSSFRCLR